MIAKARRPPGEQQVRAMFDAVAEPYDVLNRVISLGMDRPWRRRALASVTVAPGAMLLDLGSGTGEFACLLGQPRQVVGVDLSARMLARARARLGPAARLVHASAFRLPFPESTFGGAVSGFVLRNLDDLPTAFAELARVLRPGAPIALIDAAEPINPLVRQLFDVYFGTVAPAAGGLVGRGHAYQYLARSLVQLPAAPELARLLATAGFNDCRADRMALGSVVLVTAQKGGCP